ncbi:kinesin-like protein KIFC1 isoform X3 [Scylla paramamosain]
MVAILTVRVLLGIFNLLTLTVFTLETCEPKRRALLGMLLGVPWALGTMAWGGTAFLIRDWRWLQLAVSLPLLVILPVFYFMDESPRWLIVRGRHDQAVQVLRKAARWNRVTLQPEADLRALMKEIQEESATYSSTQANTDKKTKKFRLTLPILLSTRAIRIITAVVCIDYFAVSFVFDGLNLGGDNYISDPFLYITLSGMIEIPGYLLAAPIINRWGRRIPTVLSFVLGGVAITVTAFIPSELQVLRMSLALLGKWCISSVYQILYLYASELFPTEVRMQGIGVASVSSQFASTFVPFITSLLGPVLPWLTSLIFGMTAATAGMFTLALRETKDVPLPDTVADLSVTTEEAIVLTRDSWSTMASSTIFSVTSASAPEKDAEKTKMSKLPSSRHLPQPSRLRPPGSAMKRLGSDSAITSPEKRSRHSGDADDTGIMSRPQHPGGTRGGRGSLSRSVSMANLNSGVTRNRGMAKRNMANSRIGASTLNLTGRPSNITAASANLVRQGAGAVSRRPGANITNRVNNTQDTDTGPGGDAVTKAKKKRAPWDLKGRLQDMEELVKCSTVERENLLAKFNDYDSRIQSLEEEKQNLNQNLQQSHSTTQANQEQIDALTAKLNEEVRQRSNERQELERNIEELQSKKSSLERRIKMLEADLSSREDELAGLKATVSNLTSVSSGLEAQLSSTKLLLNDRNKRVADLEAETSTQASTITILEKKLLEGETFRRKLHNQVLELKGNIRVFCRVRPLIGEEIKNNGDSSDIHHINFLDERTLELCKGGDVNSSTMSGLKGRGNGHLEFTYDKVFTPCATQTEVFEEISQLVQSALDGYNVCVFAYGQTGSGKTFTMEGCPDSEELEGVITRTVRHVFTSMKELKDKGWTYTVEASFLEIYNETIRDLLVSSKEAKNLTYDIKLVDNKKNDTYVTNLKIVPVLDETQVHQLLRMAQQQRAVAATNMNEHSSRSHSVFRLKLVGENCRTSESCEGTLNLVDLAGSERLKESGSEGARLTETQNINRSLSNLGNVIMALAQKQGHIPYRNSKLTHLLQNSLGGNSKTLMFVNVSPVDLCYSETLNSLRFATKVNQCHIGTAIKQVKK